MPAPIDSKLREEIIAEYVVSNSINAVSKKYSVSWATVRKIVSEAESQINAQREEKQKKYIGDAWDVVNVYLAKLMDPKTIKEAKARDCVNVIVGMMERIQRQQELNQQYDVLYYNISKMVRQSFVDETKKDAALYNEIMRFVDGYWLERNQKDKEIIRNKIKSGDYFKADEDSSDDRERLSQLYDEVKNEILDGIYTQDDE